MFQTAAGVTVPYPEKLNEQHLRDGNTITANLSFEKLSDFIHAFYAELDEPLFLAVHPDAEADEVWYLDGMTKKQLTMILDGYGELLCQDGLSAFAIGSSCRSTRCSRFTARPSSASSRCSGSSMWKRPRTSSPRGTPSPKRIPALPSVLRSPARPSPT